MATLLLCHHANGLTPGVAFFRGLGPEEFVARAERAADCLGAGVVYAGFSLGVIPAQRLARTRPRARGALLMDACLPVGEFSPAWPSEVPVRAHAMDADPLFVRDGDIDAARDLVGQADGAELFPVPGDRHMIADRSLPSNDPPAADLLMRRVLGFLSALDGDGGAA